jgi:hypothetical protein
MDGASICGYPLSASRSIISHVSPDGVVMSKVLPNQGLVELQEWILSILNLEEFDIYINICTAMFSTYVLNI